MCVGAAGLRELEIKGKSVLNEALGRWGGGEEDEPPLFPVAGSPTPASTGPYLRCFQRRPDAEKPGGLAPSGVEGRTGSEEGGV